ncbi:uncharacterized protein [Physcomitrium patens]|uniref:Uncharacterized protein n=1 Tax=Physcomitrium patens TaxID=3218 RepID=A0A7I4CKU2_PHYPA|nr:uncharacterized protein LOC112275886 isoform X1 [Physcomitrium patens]|eukprot:XP_024362372.1 uncharacterized protein LOC112275886 isoform X1 [Physcomitrella patens]
MARSKVKITPLGRRAQNNRQRLEGSVRIAGGEQVGRDHDEENCPPNLDYNVIEEIANGVEKMILSWSHLDEDEQDHKKSTVKNENLTPKNDDVSRDDSRSRKMENPEAVCEDSKYSCDYYSCKQIQELPEEGAVKVEIPGGITNEISLSGICSGGRMGNAINKIRNEAEKHSGTMMTSDTRPEKSLTKTATHCCLEASTAPLDTCSLSVCTNESTGIKSTSAGITDVEDSSPQGLHQKRAREPNKLPCTDNSTSGHSSNTQSSPRTPPISERFAKRVQSREDISEKKLQLSISKKTRWSEKDTTAPIIGASCSEDEVCTKSPRSDCSLSDLLSNSNWNDPLVGSPCRKSSPVLIDRIQGEEFGPWDNVAGRPPVIVSRVTARSDSNLENCAKEKTSFVSFKLWKSKQSESGHDGIEETDSNKEKLHLSQTIVSEFHQGSPEDHSKCQDSEAADYTLVTSPTSDMLNIGDRSWGEMEKLQISLLECATEYELKTIEMKLKLKNIKNLKGEQLIIDPQPTISEIPEADVASTRKPTVAASTVEKVKRQIYKLQHQKGCLSKELTDLKKKEKQFELQKKSLDAALHKLDRLEWAMVKKEQEVEEWQLRQRQAEAQLRGSVMELRRFTNISELVGLPVDATSLLSLLPTLRGFVQLLAQKEKDGYHSNDKSQREDTLHDSIEVDEIVCNLMHEIQGLQTELNGMVTEDSKLKRITPRLTNGAGKDRGTHKKSVRPSLRLPRGRYPYGNL